MNIRKNMITDKEQTDIAEAKVKEIVNHLDSKWMVKRTRQAAWPYDILTLESGCLVIRVDGGSERLRINAQAWPKDYSGSTHAGKRIEITVSTARPANTLARDIQRRVITPYAAAFQQKVGCAARYSERQKAHEARCDEIATIMGPRVRRGAERLSLYGYRRGDSGDVLNRDRKLVDIGVEVGPDGDTGSLKLDGPIEQVLICLKALKAAGIFKKADKPARTA